MSIISSSSSLSARGQFLSIISNCFVPFNFYNNSKKKFYKWGNWSFSRSRNLAKVTKREEMTYLNLTSFIFSLVLQFIPSNRSQSYWNNSCPSNTPCCFTTLHILNASAWNPPFWYSTVKVLLSILLKPYLETTISVKTLVGLLTWCPIDISLSHVSCCTVIMCLHVFPSLQAVDSWRSGVCCSAPPLLCLVHITVQ